MASLKVITKVNVDKIYMMTSGGLGFTDGLEQDISQEELDFSDLFLYNPPGEDFPVSDKGV